MSDKTLIGPFRELLTMDHLPESGPVQDEQLQILQNAGIVVSGNTIVATGSFEQLRKEHRDAPVQELEGHFCAMPGLIDAHTHICWGGNRAADFAMRIAGKSYLEIAESGGGIWSTVQHTREASFEELYRNTRNHATTLLKEGVTTVEVKSGYGLNFDSEIKMLEVIQSINTDLAIDMVPTCLAAHIADKSFHGDQMAYLEWVVRELLPEVKQRSLSKRVDIFIEKSAFTHEEAHYYLARAREMGFEITAHVDQFTAGSSLVALDYHPLSVDHLEASTDREIEAIAISDAVAMALPGASIGLGERFTPARKLLDKGACLVIASDWNPGSAPQGDILMQASLLATYEHLSTAETLSGITHRAAKALGLMDRGLLKAGCRADFIAFDTDDYRNILYHQGKMKPVKIWKSGSEIHGEL